MDLSESIFTKAARRRRRWIESMVNRDLRGRFAIGLGTMVEHSRIPDGGFTWSPMSHKVPERGLMVSPYPYHSKAIPALDLTREAVLAYARDMSPVYDKGNPPKRLPSRAAMLAQPGHYFGGWHNPGDGMVVLDISIVAQSDAEARRLCDEYGQEAYYDIEQGATRYVNPGAAQQHYAEKAAPPAWWGDPWERL